MTLQCPECGAQMHLRDSSYGKFFGCERYPDCGATHGATDDGQPLGVPGDRVTREARQAAHAAFDPLWENALRMYEKGKGQGPEFLLMISRSRAYAWLAHRLGMTRKECHIGRMDPFNCDLVVRVCEDQQPENIRAWARQRSHRKKVAKLRKRWGSEQTELGIDDGSE